jgi:hypothetical protein
MDLLATALSVKSVRDGDDDCDIVTSFESDDVGVPLELVGVSVRDGDNDAVPLPGETLLSAEMVSDAVKLAVGGERDCVGRDDEVEVLKEDD